MDVGTAKPTRAEQALAPHYMIDLVSPDDVYSAQRFAEEGRRVLAAIAAEERMALVTGGTGFYIRALLDGQVLPEVPPNPELRERLMIRAKDEGGLVLHAELAAVDPTSAQRIHPHNLPRVIRALEIVEALGTPVPVGGWGVTVPALYLGLTMSRPLLHRVADARVHRQVVEGLVAETRRLLEMGYRPDLAAMQGFGYRQMVAHVQGRLSLDQAVEEYKAATRQYIRRQMTWFNRDTRIHWLEAGETAFDHALSLLEEWRTKGELESWPG